MAFERRVRVAERDRDLRQHRRRGAGVGPAVVVANRGAARENMIHEITGLVVDARQPQDLATAISGLLLDRRRRAMMGEAASAFAGRYSMDSAADGTFAEYRRFLDEWARVPRRRRRRRWTRPRLRRRRATRRSRRAGGDRGAAGEHSTSARTRKDAGGVS